MKIGIVGAGLTGLTAAYDLIQAGHQVELIEGRSQPGGLAAGFSLPDWDWSLDQHYHHVFQTDQVLRCFCRELGLWQNFDFSKVKTASLIQNEIYQLDSALSLLTLPTMSWLDKFRAGAVLAFLKIFPWGERLERWTTAEFLRTTMGQVGWEQLWQPLMAGKFGSAADQVNLAWFWARIHARTQQLGYYSGGFQQLANDIVAKLQTLGIKFRCGSQVTAIEIKSENKIQVTAQTNQGRSRHNFDQVLFTGNHHQLLSLCANLPQTYQDRLKQLQGLAAQTLILVLDQPFFKTPVYWLNINQQDWPFLAVVEHTQFVDSSHYAGQHLVYVGDYLPAEAGEFQFDRVQLLDIYRPFLKQLNPSFESHLIQTKLFKARLAQPVVGLHHSQHLPSVQTPLPGLWWAGIQQVYPYDRGINYAVKLGRSVADQMVAG